MRTTLLRTLTMMVMVAFTASAFAQINAPRPSPTATMEQVVGVTNFSVNYSRPGVKERKIFGELVPFDKVWRTGANSATTITTDGDYKLAGQLVKAGSYALYTIPGEAEWTVMLYSDLKLGGNVAKYDEKNEVVRFTTKPRSLNDPLESFTIDFSAFHDNGAVITIAWANTAIDLPIEVDTDAKLQAQIREQLIEGEGKDIEANTYHTAAQFYHKWNKDLEQALAWMNKSIEMRPDAFWYVHRQAKLLKDMGKIEEAKAAANKSMEMAKANEDGDFGYIKRNQDLLAELEK
ncbi:MAG: DUF2911 domain-containing protein [Bacteroidota bacterium]